MSVSQLYSFRPLQRIPPRKAAVAVNFHCLAPQARAVFLVGDFNEWAADTLPMQRLPDGGWHLQMAVQPGPHRYLFLVDGETVQDPRAAGTALDPIWGRVSVRTVS